MSSLVVNPSSIGGGSSDDYAATTPEIRHNERGEASVHTNTSRHSPRRGAAAGGARDSDDKFLSEMAKIRQTQLEEGGQGNDEADSAPAAGKYKQRLMEARRGEEDADDSSYKYPGYKARRRASLDDDDAPASSAASGQASSSGGDVFAQVRTRRQEDLLKAARTRKKTKEKKKAFGDQIKGVLAYLPFRTSHLSGFDN